MDKKINLLDYFDKVYCINLDKRVDRWQETLNELNKYGIVGVERYSAIDGSNIPYTGIKPGAVALRLTFINIIKEAKENNYKNILIFEDDVMFYDQMYNFQQYFENVPKDWDFLYLGTRHLSTPVKINDFIVKTNGAYTAHSLAVNSSMFDKILNELGDRNVQTDVYFGEIHPITNSYSFYPNLTTQRPSFSNIENRPVDYRWEIDQRFNF